MRYIKEKNLAVVCMETRFFEKSAIQSQRLYRSVVVSSRAASIRLAHIAALRTGRIDCIREIHAAILAEFRWCAMSLGMRTRAIY